MLEHYQTLLDEPDARVKNVKNAPYGNLTFGRAIGRGTSSVIRSVTDEKGSKFAAKTFNKHHLYRNIVEEIRVL